MAVAAPKTSLRQLQQIFHTYNVVVAFSASVFLNESSSFCYNTAVAFSANILLNESCSLCYMLLLALVWCKQFTYGAGQKKKKKKKKSAVVAFSTNVL